MRAVQGDSAIRRHGPHHVDSLAERSDHSASSGSKSRRSASVVNTPTTHGSVGMTTGLDPAMTLGCGGWGGNITSDNISPKHLLNIKRLAYETTPATSGDGPPGSRRRRHQADPTLPAVSPEVLGGSHRSIPDDAWDSCSAGNAASAPVEPVEPHPADACSLRLRGRCAAGGAGRAQNCARQPDDRDPVGARPRETKNVFVHAR